MQKHLDCLPEPFDLTDHLRGPDVGGPGLLKLIERSGSQPISVTLIFHEYVEGPKPLPDGVRRILDAHHERIVSLAVFARCVGNIFSLLSSMEQPLRTLTHLYMYSPLETTNKFFHRHGVVSPFADFIQSNWRDLDRSFTTDRHSSEFPSPGYMEHVFPSLKVLHLPRFYDIRSASCDHPHTGVTVLYWNTEGCSMIPCALGTFPNLRSLTILLTMRRTCDVEWPGPVEDTRRIVACLDHIRIVDFEPSRDSGQDNTSRAVVFDMLFSAGKKTMALEYSEWYDWPTQPHDIFGITSIPIRASVSLDDVACSSRRRLVFCEEDILGRVCTVTVPVELHHALRMSNPLLQISTTNTLQTLTIPLFRVPDLFVLVLDQLLKLHLVMPDSILEINLAQVVESWRGDDRVVAPMLQELQVRSSRGKELMIEARALDEVLKRLPESPSLQLVGVRVEES